MRIPFRHFFGILVVMKLNNIVIISGPSGVGEDSVIDGIAELTPVHRVITTTTRTMRAGESEGNPYHFITKEAFEQKITEGEMVEWAREYNEQLYGVSQDELLRVHQLGGVGIWKIEYKGVMTVQKKYPEIKSIFITAPLEVLKDRIQRRGNVSEDHIQERMEYTREWLNHTDIYDYEVENKEGLLAETISEVMDILKKEKYL